MSYVQGSTYSLKNFNDIINYYNNYLRRLYANNDPIILNSIYPLLKNNNQQILFMPFLQEFIKDADIPELNNANLPENTPNFTDYSITTDPDQNDEMEDNNAIEQRRVQEQLLLGKDKKKLEAILTDLDKKYKHDETDESGEKETKPTKKRKLLDTLASNTKSILKSIKDTLQSNEKLTAKLTAKQQAAAAAVQQKAAAAQQKAAAEQAITVFDNGLKSFEPGTDEYVIPPELYLNPSAVALFDSLHDFGYEICDTETDKKKVANYGYSKFMFSYLLFGGYPELGSAYDFNLLAFQANYSYLKGYTRPISPEGLENYFVIGNMYNIVRGEPSLKKRFDDNDFPDEQHNHNGDLQIVINTKLNYLRTTDGKYFVVENPSAKNLVKMKITSTITDNTDNEKNNRAQKQLDIYDHLAEFFAEYSDPAFADGQESFADGQEPGKIKLCIDFQSNLNKIMRKNKTKNKFCLLYTAETITDSASKSKAEAVDETFGFKNWYIEALNNENDPGGTRGHYGGPRTDIHSVKGNISVKYNSIQYSVPDDLQKADYIVNLNYFYQNNNDSINASEGENIIMNKKQTAKKAVTDKVNEFVEKKSKFFKFPTTTKNKNSIMSQIINTIKNILGKNSPLDERKNFYDSFNQNINNTVNPEMYELHKVYALYYAIKRLGDSLQAEVCKLDNLKEMLFYRVKINDSGKYAVDFNGPIPPEKGAVLVTHDRMLFAYAVINNIPAILDMENHMIIFKPRTNGTAGRVEFVNNTESNESKDTTGDIATSSNTNTSSNMNTSSNTDTSGDMEMGGGNHIQTGGDAIDDLTEDIFSNIDSFMRYLYFRRNLGKLNDTTVINYEYYGTKNIANFLEMVCELLYNENSTTNNNYMNNLHIEYITNYKYNVLLIGTPADIDIMTTYIEDKAEEKKKKTPAHDDDDDLLEVNTFIYIYISDQNYLKIIRDNESAPERIQLDFMYNHAHTSTLETRKRNAGYIYPNTRGHQFNKANIWYSLKNVDIEIYDSYLETLQIIKDSGANYLEEDDKYDPHEEDDNYDPHEYSDADYLRKGKQKRAERVDSGANYLEEDDNYDPHKNSDAGYSRIGQQKKAERVGLVRNNPFKNYKGGAPNDDEKDNKADKPSYQEILGADFDKLKDPTNLLQNNITVLTFLHQLLREYELSFINYEEGIDTFYCKINESVQLSYTIGLYNFMPRDYEFYVFLTLLIEQYNATTITTINFALFEYYLYMTKADNDIYYHYLTIKSYLLEDSYQVSMTPEIKAELQQNTETYNFFEKLMAEVTDTSYTITEIIYLDIQTKNTDYKVTNNIKNYYNLKLCGFSDLQEEFTNKTLKIIGELVEAKSPLIAKYIPNVEEIKEAEEIKGAEEIKEEEKEEVAEEEEKEEVAKGVEEEVAKGVEGVKKIPSYEKDTNKKIPINNGTPDGAVDGTTDDAVSNITTDDAVSGVKKDDAAGPSQGGKINKSTRHKYRKEKSKTKRKKTKRQQIKVQVNQTKKNRKNKKKRNTKRKIE